MRRPISFFPAHRLATLLRRPGGVTASVAVERASERLAGIRERCVAAIDDKIDALAADWAENKSPSHRAVLTRASEIFAIASIFRVVEVAHASGSLCDLMLLADVQHRGESDALTAESASAMFLDAVRVHIESLRRLRRPERGGDESGRAAIVTGLRVVTRKLVGVDIAEREDLCDERIDADQRDVA